MKKLISITLALFIFPICSCRANTIKCVTLDTIIEYHTFYLYSFKNAQIDAYVPFPPSSNKGSPTETGYLCSLEKLKVGDTVTVWQQYFFNYDTSSSNTSYYESTGTLATISKLIDTYRVKIKKTKDTYIITYYTVANSYYITNTTVSNIEDLGKIEKHKVEVNKENVIIEYDV